MSKLQGILTLGMLAFALSGAWAQDSSTPPPSTEPAPQSGAAGAYACVWPGQCAASDQRESAAVRIGPAVAGAARGAVELYATGRDVQRVGRLERRRTFWAVGGQLRQPCAGKPDPETVVEPLRSGPRLHGRRWVLQRCRDRAVKSLQQMDVDQKITWKRGQLSVRDSFSYLPEGNFGGSYGSMGSQGIASLGNSAFGDFLERRSSGNLGTRSAHPEREPGGRFRKPHAQIGDHGSRRIRLHALLRNRSARALLSSAARRLRLRWDTTASLTSHTQIALVYGYQGFDFSVLGTAFHTHVIQGLYGHRISGRMDLLLGGGPQIHLHRHAKRDL